MKKKILALKQERAQKIKTMRSMTEKAEAEKRGISKAERQAWDTLKGEIEEIDSKLARMEAEESLLQSIAGEEIARDSQSKEERQFKGFNLGKAIQEYSRGALTGLEKELADEGARELTQAKINPRGLVLPAMLFRSFTKANTGHNAATQGGYDAVADRGILAALGVTTYEDLTGQLNLVFSKGFNAGFHAEGAAVTEDTATETAGKIEPRRISGWANYSNEFLAQAATTPQMMMDMAGAIQAAAAKEVLDQILALDPLTGRGSEATGAALKWADLMKLKGAVKSLQFVSPKFVAGGQLYAHLEAVSKDSGSGRFIIEAGKIAGFSAIDTQGLMPAAGTKHAVAFGDFSRAHVGFFGGIELLVDPYTNSNKGQSKITFNRLADVAVNPYAFSHISNATIA